PHARLDERHHVLGEALQRLVPLPDEALGRTDQRPHRAPGVDRTRGRRRVAVSGPALVPSETRTARTTAGTEPTSSTAAQTMPTTAMTIAATPSRMLTRTSGTSPCRNAARMVHANDVSVSATSPLFCRKRCWASRSEPAKTNLSS